MEEDKRKRSLNYKADIQYQEDYSTLYEGQKSYEDTSSNKPTTDNIEYNDSIPNNIQNNINAIVQLMPLFDDRVQTVVNQVFKPVFNDWYKNIKDKKYPIYIPDIIEPEWIPRDPIITDKEYNPPIIGGQPPSEDYPPSGGGDDGGGGGGGGGNDDPITYPPDNKKPDPIIYTPPIDTYVPPNDIKDEDDILNPSEDDELFTPSYPKKIIYTDNDPVKIIELEFDKNILDLYEYYTSKLRETLSNYSFNLLSAMTSVESKEDAQFLFDNISLSNSKVIDNLKHLSDSGVRSELNGDMKLSFCENVFKLENSLYHMKNFKAIYELRLRYAKEIKYTDGSKESSMSNRVLDGMAQTYNAKYDVAYINLYKYLNSSVETLSDTFATLLVGMKSKETIIKKGGLNK